MTYSDSDLDSNEFATSKSSTLVVTPGNEPAKGKRSLFVALEPQKLSSLPHLQLQPLSLQANMFAGGVGKGPIQPHASNLPRRKPRRTPPAALARKSKSISSTSSTSIRTNAARSPHSVSTSPTPAVASVVASVPPFPPSSKDKPYFIDPEPTPSILAGVNTTDITQPILGSQLISAENAIFPSSRGKGHVQPHLSNVPRRKRQTLAQFKVKSHADLKEAWINRRCLQEVIKGSGIWIAFWDWTEREVTEEEDGDSWNESFVREVLSADRVIKVFSKPNGVANREPTELEADVLKLFISSDSNLGNRDDGMTRLSVEQIRAAKEFLNGCCSSQHCSSKEARSSCSSFLETLFPLPTFSIPSTSATSASSSTSIATSVSGPPSRSSTSTPSTRFYSPFSDTPSSSTSPFTSLLSKMSSSSLSSLPDTDGSIYNDTPRSPAKRLMITVPSREYAVDAMALAIVALSVTLKGVTEAMRKEDEVKDLSLLSFSSSSGVANESAGQSERETAVTDLTERLNDDENNSAVVVSSSSSLATSTPTIPTSFDSIPPSTPAWSPTFDLLMGIHDFEDLGPSWRGALSREGVEWLDEVVFWQ